MFFHPKDGVTWVTATRFNYILWIKAVNEQSFWDSSFVSIFFTSAECLVSQFYFVITCCMWLIPFVFFCIFIIVMLIVWEWRSFWSSAYLIGFEWAVCDLYELWNYDLRVYHHYFFIWNMNILFPTVSTIGSSNYIYMLQVFKNGNFNLNVFKVKYSWPIRPVFPYLWFDHCIFEYQVHDLMNCGLS